MIPVNEIPNISQTTAMGSNNSQIGLQYNHEEHYHQGLSVADATAMALEIFRQYFPQLQKEAQESLRVMLDEELTKRAPKQINPPSARIAVSTLQGASVSDEEDVRKLYAKLLASSMDVATSSQTHPAFPKIIDQMSAFDAKLMKKIVEISNSIPVANVQFTFDNMYLTSVIPHYYSPYFDDLNDPWATSLSIENLARLQLINLFDGTVETYDYDKFKTEPFVLERFEFAKKHNPTRNLTIKVRKYVIQLNDFGRRFIELCITD